MPKKGYYKNLLGQKFGRLMPIEFGGFRERSNGRNRTIWICKCDCGKTINVESSHLLSGHTTSCGCGLKEKIRGKGNHNYVNGLSTTRLARAYYNMKNRCYNPKVNSYHLYGGRGITVCNEWLGKYGFKNFCDWAIANGYAETLTLDRIDSDGKYEPSNCRWATIEQQANNKRNTKFLCINGEVDTVGNWSRRLKVSYWNLLHYAKGGKNNKYPDLQIEAVQ